MDEFESPQDDDGPLSLSEDTGSAQQVTESGTDGAHTLQEPNNAAERQSVSTSMERHGEKQNMVKADSSPVKDSQDSVAVHKELKYPILTSILKETADPKQLEEHGIVKRFHGKSSGQRKLQCRKHALPVQCESKKEPSAERWMADVTVEPELERDDDGGCGSASAGSVASCCPEQGEEEVNTAHKLAPSKCHLMPLGTQPSASNPSVLGSDRIIDAEKRDLPSTKLNSTVKISSHDTDKGQMPSAALPTFVRRMSYNNGRFIDTEKEEHASATLPVPVSALSRDGEIVIDTGQDDYGDTSIPLPVSEYIYDEEAGDFAIEPPLAKKFCRGN